MKNSERLRAIREERAKLESIRVDGRRISERTANLIEDQNREEDERRAAAAKKSKKKGGRKNVRGGGSEAVTKENTDK